MHVSFKPGGRRIVNESHVVLSPVFSVSLPALLLLVSSWAFKSGALCFSPKDFLWDFLKDRSASDESSQLLFLWECLNFAFILERSFPGCGLQDPRAFPSVLRGFSAASPVILGCVSRAAPVFPGRVS